MSVYQTATQERIATSPAFEPADRRAADAAFEHVSADVRVELMSFAGHDLSATEANHAVRSESRTWTIIVERDGERDVVDELQGATRADAEQALTDWMETHQ